MMIDKDIDKFFLRNEELEAEHEKVGKRQLDMITDEFSMEVGSPELGFGLEIVKGCSPELGFGLENVKGWFVIKLVFFSQFCQTRMRTTSLSGIGRQKLKRQIGDYRRSEMRCGMCNHLSPP